LPSIAREVGHRVDIYLDCGIRHGTDVFKALALGAKMVPTFPNLQYLLPL